MVDLKQKEDPDAYHYCFNYFLDKLTNIVDPLILIN